MIWYPTEKICSMSIKRINYKSELFFQKDFQELLSDWTRALANEQSCLSSLMERHRCSKEVIFDSKVVFLQNFLDLVRLKYHSNHEKLKINYNFIHIISNRFWFLKSCYFIQPDRDALVIFLIWFTWASRENQNGSWVIWIRLYLQKINYLKNFLHRLLRLQHRNHFLFHLATKHWI